MLGIILFVLKLGLSLGMIVLNLGIIFWILASQDNKKRAIAKEMIQSSLLLILIALLIYIR